MQEQAGKNLVQYYALFRVKLSNDIDDVCADSMRSDVFDEVAKAIILLQAKHPSIELNYKIEHSMEFVPVTVAI